MNARTEVRAMDAREPVAPHHHQKYGFRARVCFILRELAVYAQANTSEFLRPMTVLTGFPRRNQAIARQGGRNGVRNGAEHRLYELTRSILLAFQPSFHPGRDVTLDAFHLGMRGVMVRRELRRHRVAG